MIPSAFTVQIGRDRLSAMARPVSSKDTDIPDAEANLKRSSLVPVDAGTQPCAAAVTLPSMMTALVFMLNDMLKPKRMRELNS